MSRRSGAKGHRDRTGSVFQLPDHGSGSDCGGVPQHSLLSGKGWAELDGNLQDFDTRLGARLRELRTRRGLSLSDVSEEIGISYQQMQKHEAGRNSVSVKRMLRVTALLAVEPCAVLESVLTEGCEDRLSELQPFQRMGERHRILKAYFSLPEEIRLAFLSLAEEVCGQMDEKP